MNVKNAILTILGLWLFAGKILAGSILLLSTTSTENSGLLAALLPQFTKDTGIEVKVLALGTGQAMRAAQNGDGDLLLVHDQPSEETFVQQGYGRERIPLMYNDFILVGPADDPAGVRGGKDIIKALRTLAARGATFVSRGDNSGTHKAEVRLWREAGIQPQGRLAQSYREAGASMGRTLNISASIDAYTLADRGTWLSFKNKQRLVIQVEGDRRLFNQYSMVLLNPAKYPHLNHQDANTFAQWLTGEKGQAAIGAFAVDGQQLFFPNYKQQQSIISAVRSP